MRVLSDILQAVDFPRLFVFPVFGRTSCAEVLSGAGQSLESKIGYYDNGKWNKYFENREEWRRWLTDNFDTAREIWFVFPHKSSGKKSIVYNDAVEEALCFDWIDSTIRPLDAEHKIQRFTPRNPKSPYSQANKERLKWLMDNGMIHPKFEEKIQKVLSVPFVFPDDIIDRLKEDRTV